jgi:cellulose synthase/poly-beta-1,6-N-acetylglucosamine synthase-like glycosyltransferase
MTLNPTAVTILSVLFWLSVGWVFYGYVGYPLLLAALRTVRRLRVERAPMTPPLTVIVAVHNGAGSMRGKLDNLLGQDYPADRVQLIVADDASTDGTTEVARGYADRGVRLVRLARRGGKEMAQQAAMQVATGEIVVFTDVGTLLALDGLSRIVESFADPSVGCVSSTDRVIDETGSPAAEGLYVRYEMALRRLEMDVSTLVGLSGSFFAARRSHVPEFSDRMCSDFCTLFESVRRGLRGVADERAHGHYFNIADPAGEFKRKVRTVLRGLTAFFAAHDLLNPIRHPLFAWQFVSHKFVRWTVPFAMVLALGTSAALALHGSVFFAVVLGTQLAAYLYAALAESSARVPAGPLGRVIHYFVIVNASILVAWTRYLSGERVVTWNPSAR